MVVARGPVARQGRGRAAIAVAVVAGLWGTACAAGVIAGIGPLGSLTLAPGPPRTSAAAAVPVVTPNPFATGMRASKVVGQPNFLSAILGAPSASQLSNNTSGLAVGSNGTLWVADHNNDRILAFAPPFVAGEGAYLVLGQSNFDLNLSGTNASSLSGPNATIFDRQGDLWVADSGNNRVLEYLPPFHDGMRASLVLGQTNFTTRTAGTTASTFDNPGGLAFSAAGDLFVADTFNNRILEFVPPFEDGMAASLVLGQVKFTTSSTGGINQTNLHDPAGLAVAPNGALWVADEYQDRTLEFVPPFANDEAASIVLGENNFTTGSENAPVGQYLPTDVAVDPQGNVWVADPGADRITEYVPPFSINETQSVVLGQQNFTYLSCPALPNASRTCSPSALAFDARGDLWVGDSFNARVLEFAPESFAWTFTEGGLASGTTWTVSVDGTALSNTTSASGGTITFEVWNGTHTFSVGSVGGYAVAPGSGTRSVNATAIGTTVAFSPTIEGLPPLEFLLAVGVVVVAIAAAFVVVFFGSRGGGASPPASPLRPSPPASTTGSPGTPPTVPPGAG